MTPEQQEQRRRREWEESLRQRCGIAGQLPNWAHTTSAAAFAKTVKSPQLLTFAERWSPSKGSALLLGPSGIGKTSTLMRAVRRLTDQTIEAVLNEGNREPSYGVPLTLASKNLRVLSRARWVKAWDIVEAMGPYGTDVTARFLEECRDASFLVLDEVGPEPPKHAGVLFRLIDHRHEFGRPTLATSGMTRSAFVSRYGDAMLRRLTDKALGNRLIDVHPKEGGR